MKKRVFNCIFAVLMIFTLLMSGCATTQTPPAEEPSPTPAITPPPEATEAFVMHKVGDTVYINFENGNTYEPPEFVQVTGITFESLADMKRTIKNNSFTRSQAAIIKTSFKKDENGIKICDPDKLYQPMNVNGLNYTGVCLGGEIYAFFIHFAGDLHGMFIYHSKEDFDKHFKYAYTDYFEHGNVTITSVVDGHYGNVPTKEYYYTTVSGVLKEVRYTLNVNGKTLIVNESYCLQMDDGIVPVSETVPYTVNIYGTDNGVNFSMFLCDFTSRPTVEWLSQFGVEEYKE